MGGPVPGRTQADPSGAASTTRLRWAAPSGTRARQRRRAAKRRRTWMVVKVGIPREVKNNEYRVAITPAGVHELVRHGHEVYVEQDAGTGSPRARRALPRHG